MLQSIVEYCRVLHFLSISSFSLRFSQPGCHNLCNPVTRLEICVSVTHASVWVGPNVMVGRCGGIPTPAPREGLPTHHPPPQVPSRQLMPPNFLCRHPPNLFNVKADYSGNFDRHSYDGGEAGNLTQTHVVNFTCRIHNDSLLFGK